jgi:hypothetical protein
MKVQSVEIIKQGLNKKGKKWVMYRVELEDGRTASGFDLVRVGDNVSVQQSADGKFLNYSADNTPSYPEEGEVRQEAPVNAPQSPVARSNGGGGTMLDARQRAIIRQHSQTAALSVLTLKLGLNQLTLEDLTPAKLRQLADYFDRDVINAAEGKTDEPY